MDLVNLVVALDVLQFDDRWILHKEETGRGPYFGQFIFDRVTKDFDRVTKD
ncbi:hypothetical protein N9383_06745 [Granulosicoccus sp.]|nr:hypothetical protein [Granulosicoccus sp.]